MDRERSDHRSCVACHRSAGRRDDGRRGTAQRDYVAQTRCNRDGHQCGTVVACRRRQAANCSRCAACTRRLRMVVCTVRRDLGAYRQSVGCCAGCARDCRSDCGNADLARAEVRMDLATEVVLGAFRRAYRAWLPRPSRSQSTQRRCQAVISDGSCGRWPGHFSTRDSHGIRVRLCASPTR